MLDSIAPAKMSEEERKLIGGLAATLEDFVGKRDRIPVSHVISLLRIALDEGKSQKYYSNKWDVPPATVSRMVLDFGTKMRKGEPGLGLIDSRVSDHSLREHQTYLSPAGRDLLKGIMKRLRPKA